jgi:hypothetical protein
MRGEISGHNTTATTAYKRAAPGAPSIRLVPPMNKPRSPSPATHTPSAHGTDRSKAARVVLL